MRTQYKDGGDFYSHFPKGLLDMELTTIQLSVYCVLATFADKEDKCWPSQLTIANKLHKSVRTIKRSIKELVAKRVIRVVRQNGSSGRRYNCYELLDLPIRRRNSTNIHSPSDTEVTNAHESSDKSKQFQVTKPTQPKGHRCHSNEDKKKKDKRNEGRSHDQPDFLLEEFSSGFNRLYGHTPRLADRQLREWAALRRNIPESVLRAKIAAWWEYPLPRDFRGNRTFGAFVGFFDSIPIPNDDKVTQNSFSGERWLEEMRAGTDQGREHFREIIGGTDTEKTQIAALIYGGIEDEEDARAIIKSCTVSGT